MQSISNDKLLNTQVQYIKLRHPSTEKPAYFCIVNKTTEEISNGNRKIYEIVSHNQQQRSWLIENIISSNNIMHISTPINPLFFALYILYK